MLSAPPLPKMMSPPALPVSESAPSAESLPPTMLTAVAPKALIVSLPSLPKKFAVPAELW